MHEYSIAESLIKLIAEHADRSPRKRVKSAKVIVGKMTSVVPATLRFYFEILPKPAAMRDTVLDFEEVSPLVKCEKCDTKWETDLPVFVCANCGATKVSVLSGMELTLQSIEVED